MKSKQFILMGDIVKSSQYEGRKLHKDFRALIDFCNNKQALGILSPYTITLGDEFQGIAKDLRSVITSIFFFEESILKMMFGFKIRYVLHYGEIETPLNREIAYGMLGNGLVKARKMLSTKRRDRPKYQFDLENPILSRQFNRLFYVLEGFARGWSQKDFALIFDMLQKDSDNEIALKHKKNRSQIWKRKRHLYIQEYKTIKAVIFDIIANK
jgi:hypothetical protein